MGVDAKTIYLLFVTISTNKYFYGGKYEKGNLFDFSSFDGW